MFSSQREKHGPHGGHGNQGQGDVRQPEDDSRRKIAIYSDPGRTSLIMRKILDEPNRDWARHSAVAHEQALIPLRTDGTLDLDQALQWARNSEADITIVVTEVPRTAGRRSKTTELHFAEKLAVISLPALGPIGCRGGLRVQINGAVRALIYDTAEEARTKGGLLNEVRDQQGHETVYVNPRLPVPSRVWMLMGMVVANEPLWSMPKLSGVFAAAVATGAFGVFFSTIWEMSNALPWWRLMLASLISVAAVVTWLIVSNRLWDRPADLGGRREAMLYNISTIVSLVVSVATLYAILFFTILAMGLMLIDPDFLAATVENADGEFRNYVDIAWMAASMGTVAGAFGSNFDDNVVVRNLTQGSREAQRYPRDEEQS